MKTTFYLTLIVCAAGLLFSSCDSNDPEPVEFPSFREVAEEDFTVTATGLKYFDFAVGDTTLAPAQDGQSAVVHYSGWLENGFMFDSSVYFRGTPIVFLLGTGRVIPGWDEGIKGMYPGGERQLVIPPDLAYGSTGTQNIPPNATLIFEVVYLGRNTAN